MVDKVFHQGLFISGSTEADLFGDHFIQQFAGLQPVGGSLKIGFGVHLSRYECGLLADEVFMLLIKYSLIGYQEFAR